MQYFVTVVVFLSSFSNILILGGRCCFWFWLLWKLADSKLIEDYQQPMGEGEVKQEPCNSPALSAGRCPVQLVLNDLFVCVTVHGADFWSHLSFICL